MLRIAAVILYIGAVVLLIVGIRPSAFW